jgi:hypothetical protein
MGMLEKSKKREAFEERTLGEHSQESGVFVLKNKNSRNECHSDDEQVGDAGENF